MPETPPPWAPSSQGAVGVTHRLVPDRTWLRFAAALAGRPRTVARRGRQLAAELAAAAKGSSDRRPGRGDSRFRDPAWQDNRLLHRLMQAYLATADLADELLSDAELDWRDNELLKFQLDNLIAALAPSNLPGVNPLSYKEFKNSRGASAVRGLTNLGLDLAVKPRVPTLVERDAFTVGGTVAATPGAVVYQSEIVQLIQYTPRTPQVYATPLLIVPPVINKFYVLDLAPGRSMIEYFLDNQHQVFTLSWRNPQAQHRDWGLDTYAEAVLDALDVVEKITGCDRTQLLGTCSGGTLAAMLSAHLTATGRSQRLAGLALGVTVLDQTRAGTTAATLDREAADKAISASAAVAYLDGRSLAEVFAWLRPNDLVWRYWVNNYLLGRAPEPFDVLFWNADTVRMTASLHRDFVTLAVDNALVTPGAATLLGTPVDLSAINLDTYFVAGIADHICPWQACYRSAQLFTGSDMRFVLSTNGHIASLVNPPGNPRSSYRARTVATSDAGDWLDSVPTRDGSWWPDYTAWLAERSGPLEDAPRTLGCGSLPPLMPAPGSYVRQN
jgi:poly[(R)-3-hydroxyalkanoate] polymerase subunit PhaC